MKITDIEGIILRLPVVRAIGDGCQSVLLIRVHTDEGLVGIGEAHTNPLVSKAILDAPLCSVSAEGLRSLLIGEDPRDIGRLWDKMYKHSATYGRRGALMHAMSGVDIALWDLLGKIAGLPIHRLLGGPRRDAVRAYASDLSQPDLGDTIALARRHCEAGFRAMKFGWGGLGQNPRADARAVAAIRAEIGDAMDLMIDIGVPMPLDDALYLGRAFADSGVYFLEEPLSPDDVAGFARLVAQSPTPIATGEKETTQYPYLDLMDRGGLRIIQPDVARVGGISETLRIVHHAEARGARVIPHCWSTDILVAATLHVLAVQRDAPYLEFNATDNPLRTDLLVEPMRVVDGFVRVPDGPGLGITLNDDTIARYRWTG
ncbi:mandelate racemase/muconate lactonizing enzyme family protein [Chelatococcus asaccharovorans]|uniref:L-alanine-DL-glutamate epimerase-like enolase superfamily enzyme n=1 Tax=Chelatococcus asaccharovorans TaxID=28210 RepID=A0A2V3UI66_9HYPH|nr:mandelate racemase/muconate lactonizing enzyme family protein [Chelatococcus asaccharovorans]MBS7706488.1 mandelate racemase/muconate lactonizing enzyme family protein [Chelatococcus asaccharovorans]PXW64866.1 L-alanine-DL-glutamate epimerase-like enolase superfamily enzyme [Chelatococcus asaccharovorans]